jgi:hypothetical protein
MLKFEFGVNRDDLESTESGGTTVLLISLLALKNSFGALQNEFSQINHALSEAVDFTYGWCN